MAFNKGFQSLTSASMPTENATSIASLPTNILEAFIPGYSLISKFLLEVLGFDVTVVVSVCFLAFGLFKAITYLSEHAYSGFHKYFMSTITIDSDDDIYDHIMAWIGDQNVSKNCRELMAKSGLDNAWDEVDGEDMDDVDLDTLVNFSNWDAKVPPRFQPFFGKHIFFHNGRFFEFKREPRELMSMGWGGTSVFQREEIVKLTCIGRSTQPIKDLIRVCRDRHIDREKSRTVVRRPAAKEQRQRGRNAWMRVATRPSRPMETVVLDPEQKSKVLSDINEYLHPATPRWYANRGIPYRRGYLFHGPPGTGKTSLSFAIAGIFGLDIYCISLLEPTLTEEDLGLLFNSLPRRCVVLLEDIDTAGLTQRQEENDADKDKIGDNSSAQIGVEIAKAFKSAQEKNEKDKNKNQGISLSGLLNAIDGVASHEGRVLVMTTNFPEKLDDALIRPGRVDMKVAFTMATQAQIHELFVRMYSPDSPTSSLAASNLRFIHKANGHVKSNEKPLVNGELTPPRTPRDNRNTSTLPTNGTTGDVLASAQLKSIADRFAALLPEDKFTPAEIQGFLLTRKKEPRKALEEVEEWRDRMLAAKVAKLKVAPAA